MPRAPRPTSSGPSSRRRDVRRTVRAIRRRRSPEDARREILDAAELLFASHHPDALGLKPVARAAGVSHALVTHYFGTYAGLVDAVLERRQMALRDHLVAKLRDAPGIPSDTGPLFAALFESLGDPVHVRLWRWTLATERPAAATFFALRNQGLRAVALTVATAVAAEHRIDVERIRPAVEIALLTALAAAFGYSLGKEPLVGALGATPSPAIDAAVQAALRDMVAAQIRNAALAIVAG
jgi:AcrR family transcriptional regulator